MSIFVRTMETSLANYGLKTLSNCKSDKNWEASETLDEEKRILRFVKFSSSLS